ncbi:FAD-dependent oxidoreductase [Nocardioides sp. NPDC051685]|uniref:FAD-dependent oxidoreductase n=1 Tax=Nocardioides sp. NPDC051685 TaxID=3364334 RepID=UPI0037BAA871
MSIPSTCDVLIIGSGAGGLSAAITAAAGGNVLVIEAADKLGGAAAYSGGQIWAGLTDAARAAGIADSRQEVEAYLDWLSEGTADLRLRDVFIDRGPDAIRFLPEHGVPIAVVRSSPDRHPTAEARRRREQVTMAVAREFATGTASTQDLNPTWGKALMEIVASGDLSPVDAMSADQMAAETGNSAHEVRTWVAAFSALGQAGPSAVDYSFYRPIRDYIGGFGVMAARTP